EARTGLTALDRASQPAKGLEHLRYLLGRYADATVAHRDLEAARDRNRRKDLYCISGAAELDGIAQNVHPDLLELAFVGKYRRDRRLAVNHELNTSACCGIAHQLRAIRDQPAHIDQVLRQLHFTHLDLREV